MAFQGDDIFDGFVSNYHGHGLRLTVLTNVTLCYAILCHVTIRYVILCYV